MTTLRDLKPCIDEGHTAVRIGRESGSIEFVDRCEWSYVYSDGVPARDEDFWFYDEFDDLLQSIGDIQDEIMEVEERQMYNKWDLLPIEEEG